MKLNHFTGLLIILLANSCKKPDPAPVVSKALAGNWEGTYHSQKASSCDLGYGSDSLVRATATWKVVNDSITGIVDRRWRGQTNSAEFIGRFDGDTIRVENFVYVSCNSVSRTYLLQFKGTITNNTLTLVATDMGCPQFGCIYRQVLTLSRQ